MYETGPEVTQLPCTQADTDRVLEAGERSYFASPAVGQEARVALDPTKYFLLKQSKQAIVAAVNAEQNLWLLVENYLDYERELIDMALSKFARYGYAYADMQHDRLRVNRRIVNLLSSARMYLDHLRVMSGDWLGIPSANLLQAFMSQQYDQRLGYRVMEQLRNVVQHSAMGVHTLGFPTDVQGGERRSRSIPYIGVKELALDSKFKAQVLEELRQIGSQHQLTPFVRSYMEGIGAIHAKVRSVSSDFVETSSQQIRSWLNEMTEAGHPDQRFVLEARESAGLSTIEGFHVFAELLDQREQLVIHNRTLTGASSFFASGQSDPAP